MVKPWKNWPTDCNATVGCINRKESFSKIDKLDQLSQPVYGHTCRKKSRLKMDKICIGLQERHLQIINCVINTICRNAYKLFLKYLPDRNFATKFVFCFNKYDERKK